MGEERIDLTFDMSQAMKSLEDVNRKVETLRKDAKGITFGQAGQLAGAALGGSATGQAIAGFAASSPIERLVSLVETLVRVNFPTVLAKLDIIGRAQGAERQVAPIVEQAARLGIKVNDKQLESMIGQALESEGRAQIARNRVHASVFKQAGQSAIDDSGLQGLLENVVGPRQVQPRNR